MMTKQGTMIAVNVHKHRQHLVSDVLKRLEFINAIIDDIVLLLRLQEKCIRRR